jgi:tetratricopeptide (TPR) repeat protein
MKKCKQCNFSWPDNIEECPVDGSREFIDAAAVPPPTPPKPLPACCPNPDCPTLLVTKGGKFCSECATRLKPVTLAVWDEKLVSPALQKSVFNVLLDPSELFRAAAKMGLMQDDVEAHLNASFRRLTGSGRDQLYKWIQESVIPLRDEDENPLVARQHAMEQAASAGIDSTFALKILDELAPWETIAPEPTPDAAADDTTAPTAPTVEPNTTATAADAPAAPVESPGEELARQSYGNFLRGFKVSPEPIFLSVEGGSSISDMLDGKQVVLKEHSQGAIVLFPNAEGGESGWLYPNAGLHYREEPLRRVFPHLNEGQFNFLKQRKSVDGSTFKPVPVKRLDASRWQVMSGRDDETVQASVESSTTAKTTATATTAKTDTTTAKTDTTATIEKDEPDSLSNWTVTGDGGKSVWRGGRLVATIVCALFIMAVIAALLFARDTDTDKMESAIAKGQLVKPQGASAYDYYQRLKSQGLGGSDLAAVSGKLLPALLSASQKLLQEAYQPGGRTLSDAEWKETLLLVEWAGELKPQDKSLAAKVDYCKGQVAYLRGDEEEATKLWRRAVELDTGWALPSHSLSLLYHRAGKYTLERGCLVEASRRDPDWAIPYANMGDWFAKVKRDSASAESFYRKAAERAPRWATPHAALADLAMRKRDYNTAIRELELALNTSADVSADVDLEKLKRDLAYARRFRSKR